ncbi:macro domain-containing protein [Haloferula sp. BvORR071]|uniref:macro domain-containing protein n=1 Tax=Haloferula sp. BvORR071 TaxID=1396141 RepID=UPI0006971385|nr:macro domain-containing protein [Haloferula sp. BvORR071]
MKFHLIDSNPDVAAALKTAFAAFGEVEVRCGNLLTHAEECVVSPANSYGFMDGGFDSVLYGFFGPQIQVIVQDAISGRPEGLLPVGAAMLVPTGHHRIPFLLVAPTMTLPGEVTALHAYRAMRAVLRMAWAECGRIGQVYCPGLGTGVGAVGAGDAASEMARAYRDHHDANLIGPDRDSTRLEVP